VSAPDFVASNLYSKTMEQLRQERRVASPRFVKNSITLVEEATDFLVCIAGMITTNALCSRLPFGALIQFSPQNAASIGSALGLIVVFLLHREGTYRKDCGLLQIRETERTLRVPVEALFLLLTGAWFLGFTVALKEVVVASFVIPMMLTVGRRFFLMITTRLEPLERVVVYGSGDTSRTVISTLLQSPRLGFVPVAVIDDNLESGTSCLLEMGYRGRHSIVVQPGPVTTAQLKALRGDILIVARPLLSAGQLSEIMDSAQQIGLDVAVLRDHSVKDQFEAESLEVDGITFTTSRTRPHRWIYESQKRIADIIAASTLMLLLFPLFLLIAILIRLDSPGPALFIQKRVGRNSEPFRIVKFRSMFVGAPIYAASPTSSSDPRITRIGRLLRRVSLDELPQLINVLLGSMSLVGPRPEMPFVVERYDERQQQRLQVTPGITGIWQLSADRSFPIHHNIEYDLYYIRNRSFFMDVAILIHTLAFALCGGI
jgi:exopolysaccharide biosynthesis polyprenyl glycosylphosphotransferase